LQHDARKCQNSLRKAGGRLGNAIGEDTIITDSISGSRRKIYPIDAGLIPVFDRSGRANLGHALETAVLVELKRRRHTVTYVRTSSGYEVDFLARSPEGAVHLIQVCADASDPDTATRELRA
jgi:predicted AAA+ superfamily ATPase